MASINDVRKLVYNKFITDWADETPFTLDNESFDDPNSSWVRLVVRNRISGQDTLGPTSLRKFLRSGSIFVQVFTPVKRGTSEGDRLAKRVRDIFEGVRLGPESWVNEVDIREVGPGTKWYQHNVEASLTYEDTK